MKPIRFNASLSIGRALWLSFAIGMSLLLGCLFFIPFEWEDLGVKAFYTFLIFIPLLIGAIMRVRYYEWNGVSLVIKAPFHSVVFPVAEIQTVRRMGDKELPVLSPGMGFGDRGFFGNFGRFHSFKLGWATWYTTDTRNAVLIETTGNKKIILSPDEPEKFVHVMNNTLSA